MGAFLLASGAKGKRLALPNSDIMIHQLSSGFQGQATDIEINARYILKLKSRLNTLLAKHTGKSPEVIEKDSDRDNWMSSDEAKKYGLIDKVLHTKA